jgi:hypothetical protein
LIFICGSSNLFSQSRNNIWCFGDSAGIDFNSLNSPIPKFSFVDGRGSCVSIADSSGQLLWYAYTKSGSNQSTIVRSKNDSIMQNGSAIAGQAWYRELVIVPDPANSSLYYLISSSVTSGGLFYSVIDLTQNGGLGAVTQKNIQLLSVNVCDGLQAIKHGNGRDWWVFVHSWYSVNDTFYKFLVTPQGVLGPYIQTVGTSYYQGFTNINFSKSGNKVAIINPMDVFELYDFDRCSGDFSNPQYLNLPTGFAPFYHMWSCEFSPDEELLYVSTHNVQSYIYQVNLSDLNPWSTRDTLWMQDSLVNTGGQLELGPDNKIYYSSTWYDGIHNFYPYPDSQYYQENMNLGVINNPNMIGINCDFQPYSFYLGGKRTYLGLPNNPEYDMIAMGGSICDTLGLPNNLQDNINQETPQLKIFYYPDWQIIFINASSLHGKYFNVRLFDIAGKLIYEESGQLSSAYFTKDVPLGITKGLYLVSLETDKEILSGKFLVE